MAYVYINDFCLSVKKDNKLSLTEIIIYSMIFNFSKKDIYYGGFKYCRNVIDISKSQYYLAIQNLKNKKLIYENEFGQLVCNFPVRKTDNSVRKTDNSVRKTDNSVRKTDNSVRKTDSNIILKNINKNINKISKPPIIPQGGDLEISPSDSFNIFFEKYPVKVDKDRCFKYWQNNFSLISKNINLIMNALDEQINSDRWKTESGKYIPYPLKWLKNKHWENIYPKTSTNEYTQSWTAEYRKELENL